MNNSDIIIAILLLVLCFGLLGYFCKILFLPLKYGLRNCLFSNKLKRANFCIQQAEYFFNLQKYKSAAGQIRKSILLDVVVNNKQIFLLKELYQNILSRLVIFNETSISSRVEIGSMEKLLFERVELLMLLSKATNAFDRLHTRRKQDEKIIPIWTKKDFEQRNKQIIDELKRNERELAGQLNLLFNNFQNNSAKDITYH